MIYRSAQVSSCRNYRYQLSRWWGPGKRVAWLMYNPSTADCFEDDATIRKCVGFSREWGFDGLEVINLFAYRSTDPAALRNITDPVGPDFAVYVAAVVNSTEQLICAWGCESELRKMRKLGHNRPIILQAIRSCRPNFPLYCLGKSKSGNPYHPLMLAYSTQRVPFEVPA